MKFTGETVWLSQQQMAELYQTTRPNIVQHIKNIYADGELDEVATCKSFLQVRQEGNRQVSRVIPLYNLDMIISLGYRIRSVIATPDFAEIQAIKRRPMYMSDHVQQLDNILPSTGEALLNGPGSVSHQQAMAKAEQEYRLFQVCELSPVERAYLDTIKTLNAKAKGKGDKEK